MATIHRGLLFAHSRLVLGVALGMTTGVVLAQATGDTLEEIVITAEKREENLQTVPVAVTALTAQALDILRYTNVKDLNDAAPGLTVRISGGGTEEPVFTLRGVYATANFASDPAVALYMDGVYVSNVNGANFDLADVERIEVLRGPQGTLFGRNAIAGAINIITKEPSGTLQGKQEFAGGNLGQFRSKTSIDSPQWGPLSASLTFLHDEMNGDIQNLGAGTVWHFGPATNGAYGDLVSPSTLGGHDVNAVAAALKFEPGSDFKAVYRFNYSQNNYVPDGSAPGTFGTSLGFLFQPFWAAQNPALRSPEGITRPDAVNNWYTTPGVIRTESQSLTITAPVSDTVSIKSITGYRSLFLDSTNDLSGIGGLYSPFTPNTPLLPIVNATQSNQKSFQEELQANIDTTWVYSTVGYLYWWGHTNEGNFPNTYNAPFGSGLGITAPYLNFVAPTAATVDDSLTTISDALYTQDQVHLTHQLDLVGGARWTKDQRSGLDGASTPPASAVFPIEYHKSTWTYMGGLNYKINEDIFAYLKYSTAYISGGEVANINFQPTTARSWETGLKADLLEHKLRVNLALFTVGYGQFQILTGPRAGCPPSLFPSVSLAAPFCIINGGDAKDGGAELELTYVPVTGLTLEGSVAHNNMHFTRVNPGLSVEGTFVAPQSPVWTASLSAAYRGSDLGALYGSHVVGMVQAQYTSSQFPQAADPLPLLESVEIPAKTIINGRAGLGGFKFGPTEIEVVGYVKNLTNNRSEAFGADLAADFAVTFERARTYGIDVTASF